MTLYKNLNNGSDNLEPWVGDQLNRQKIAKKLTTILTTVKQPFVVSIEAPFGGGKSFFLQHWQKSLKEDNANTVFFNAWETDYADDPLMAFLATLEAQLPDIKNSSTTKSLNKNGIIESGKKLLTSMALNVIETGSAGIIKASDITNADDNPTIQRYANFKSSQQYIVHFQAMLTAYGKKLREQDSKNRPVIIFVDELDRCRPNYAIEVLEAIKHFFSVENFVFVLGVDKAQLSSSIGAVYGPTVDGTAYLQKFIEWSYRLPEPKTKEFITQLLHRFHLEEVLKSKDNFTDGSQLFTEYFTYYSRLFSLQLRDVERYFTQLNVIMRSFDNRPIFPMLLVLLVIVRDKNPTLYRKYCTEQVDDEQVMHYLKDLSSSHWFMEHTDKRYARDLLHAWIVASGTQDRQILDCRFEKLSEKYNELSNKGVPIDQKTEYMVEILSSALIKHDYFCKISFPYTPKQSIANYLYDHIEDITQ